MNSAPLKKLAQAARQYLSGARGGEVFMRLCMGRYSEARGFAAQSGVGEELDDEALSALKAEVRQTLTDELCAQGVEIIGWLYQFYASARKDEVMAKRRGGRIAAADIPVATQLFTPEWIVRYMAQNTLGRLWLLNRPQSRLASKMEYYLPPAAACDDFLRVSSPTELRICDPACGTGHILTYAFDLLYEIYAEDGYPPSEIPALILRHNLYGMDLDENATRLASFALKMKAMERSADPPPEPHICALSDLSFTDEEVSRYASVAGGDVTPDLMRALRLYEPPCNFGALLYPEPAGVLSLHKMTERVLRDEAIMTELRRDKELFATHLKILRIIARAEFLSRKYHVVVANPPYMAAANMNMELNRWLFHEYDGFNADLFAAFMRRNTELALPGAHLGFMTPFVWLFIGSYEKLRSWLIEHKTLISLIQPEKSSFEEAAVSVCAFTLVNSAPGHSVAEFIRLTDFTGAERQAQGMAMAARHADCPYRYRVPQQAFHDIPGKPIAYWLNPELRRGFKDYPSLAEGIKARNAMKTGDNEQFLRLWHEVPFEQIGFNMKSADEALSSGKRWFPYNKGGGFRKWYGNHDYVLNWHEGGAQVMGRAKAEGRHIQDYPHDLKFIPVVSWSLINGEVNGFRYYPSGFIADIAGMCAFGGNEEYKLALLAYANSNYAQTLAKVISSTVNFQTGDFGKLPYPAEFFTEQAAARARRLIELAKEDWNAAETSWEFEGLPLLKPQFRRKTLAQTYAALRAYWQAMTDETARLEEDNNRHLNSICGVEKVLPTQVPLKYVTLNCNPAYRYAMHKDGQDTEALLLADTMRDLISYAVGCMFGRFRLDGIAPVKSNALPLSMAGMKGDLAARLRSFLKTIFGREHLSSNLRFLERALNVGGKAKYGIRDYFTREFYKDHVKRYGGRPIYWLFSSGNSNFNALVYLHRYDASTPRAVKKALQSWRAISAARMNAQALSAKRKIRAQAVIRELTDYENTLNSLIKRHITLNLNDGVKRNYHLLGNVLKKLP